jgi:pyruvate kinase
LLDDGKLIFKLLKLIKNQRFARVIQGGELKSKKGVNYLILKFLFQLWPKRYSWRNFAIGQKIGLHCLL